MTEPAKETAREPVLIKKWHPFAMLWPQMQGEQWKQFKASIKAFGGNRAPILYRLVDGEPQGLDGRNRYRACRELKLEPYLKLLRIADDKIEQAILDANEYRRHMDAEGRKAIVLAMRGQGASTRKIAGVLNVDPKTVRNDIKEAGGEFSAPAVKGADGKTYQPVKPILEGIQVRIDAGEVSPKLVPEIAAMTKTQQGVVLEALQQGTNPREAVNMAQEAPGPKPAKVARNGEAFPLPPFRSAWGALYREIDRLGNAYGCKETPLMEGLRRKLVEWKKEFEDALKSLSTKEK